MVARIGHDLEVWLSATEPGAVARAARAVPAAVEEIALTARRARTLVRRGRYPRQGDGWPRIPWPPF